MLKRSKWIKRSKWTIWVCVDRVTNLVTDSGPVTREDLLATDWEADEASPPEEEDDSSVRFGLIEIE